MRLACFVMASLLSYVRFTGIRRERQRKMFRNFGKI
jgi:hypothetical protein